jgi:D-beta-D-heptose 7-phosphate kinase/D-beta-D-heptose 1-phosphate adenosyltransferase
MSDLMKVLDDLGEPQVLVVGDLILDRYTRGTVERLTPEAPVPVLHGGRRRARLGGAAAVARLVRALGAGVALAGVTGGDAAGYRLRHLLEHAGVEQGAVLTVPDRPTTVKERFLGRAGGRPGQLLLRRDREQRTPLPSAWQERLLRAVLGRMAGRGVVLVADYGKGVCTPGLFEELMARAEDFGVPVLVDPCRTGDWARYRGAALLTPNRHEAAHASGLPVRTPQQALRAARWLRGRYLVDAVLVKLDRDGLVMVDRDGREHVCPAATGPVCDVTGAGDLVLAVAGLCRAAGVDWPQTLSLCSTAAALEVARPGVAAVRRSEVRAALAVKDRSGRGKRVSRAELAELALGYRRMGQRVVLTNGCFDLLHAGHVSYLAEAARLGEVLVVAINGDAGVRRLKGMGRPLVTVEQRAAVLAALACVDHVVVFEEDTPHALLREVRPDVLVKGGTYAVESVVGREVVESYGGRVCVTDKVEGLSTTRLLAALRATVPDVVKMMAGNGQERSES